MRTLIWSNTFLRAFKRLLKKQPDRREEIEKTLRLLLDNPFNPKLETHKLKGKLSGTWACSVGYDLRIIATPHHCSTSSLINLFPHYLNMKSALALTFHKISR